MKSMIKSFSNKETAAVFANQRLRRFGNEWQQAVRRKLAVLNRVAEVEELLISPANQLQKTSGSREGQWSIRINAQWRLYFTWRDGHAWEVFHDRAG